MLARAQHFEFAVTASRSFLKLRKKGLIFIESFFFYRKVLHLARLDTHRKNEKAKSL